MLKRNFRRLFVLFGVIIFIFTFAGCSRGNGDLINNNEAPKAEDVKLKSDLIDDTYLNNTGKAQNKDDQQDQAEEEWKETFAENFGDGKVSFNANPYMQGSGLSWVYILKITVEGEKIYINDAPYKQSSSFAPPPFSYGNIFFIGSNIADRFDESQDPAETQKKLEEEASAILKKLEDCQLCYILETDEDTKLGKKIAVYKIDNAFYFVNFYEDGNILRIHRAVVE